MELWYILAVGAIAAVSLVLVILMAIGFIKGLKEPYRPEAMSTENSAYPETRIQHVDCFGTWDGYSVPGDSEGEWKHFNSFGTQIGSSKKGW